VLHAEPASPRQLNSRVPVDLETICLKCLQKDPGRRSGSAAEDLAAAERQRQRLVPNSLSQRLAWKVLAEEASRLIRGSAPEQSPRPGQAPLK
jgi:hypothetical protein